MKLVELIRRTRSLTRDFTNSIFREQDIIDFINEGLNRFKQVIPEVKNAERLINRDSDVEYIPEEYQHLLSVYATSRCFGQDERHYQATTYMNEFEVKLDQLKQAIDNGDVIIKNPDGDSVDKIFKAEYVDLKPYWGIGTSKEEGVDF